MNPSIRVEATSDPQKARAALAGKLGFGQQFADLMVTLRHDPRQGWHDAAIVPFGPLLLSPAAKVLHYGQEIFEGHKAYRQPSGEVALFRPEQNAKRLNESARRMLLPEIEIDWQLALTEALVDRVRGFVPTGAGTALYLRPTLISTDPTLGVSPASEHLYFVIASPVGAYFEKGFAAIRLRVEDQRCRAAPGGVGLAKTGGNYAAGLAAQQQAKAEGFDHVLFLDALEHRYLEESNVMNIFWVEDGALCTPPLGDTILDGITRRSVLELAADLGLGAAQRRLAIDELWTQAQRGQITEMFAVGTGAIITPVAELGHQGRTLTLGNGQPGPIARRVYDALFDIQYGRAPDPHGWMRVVPRGRP